MKRNKLFEGVTLVFLFRKFPIHNSAHKSLSSILQETWVKPYN